MVHEKICNFSRPIGKTLKTAILFPAAPEIPPPPLDPRDGHLVVGHRLCRIQAMTAASARLEIGICAVLATVPLATILEANAKFKGPDLPFSTGQIGVG